MTLLTTVSRVLGTNVTVHLAKLCTKLSNLAQISYREMVLDSDRWTVTAD